MFLVLASAYIVGSCAVSKSSGTTGALAARDLEVYGRHYLNDNQELALVSSAAHFGFSFRGNVCSLYVSLPAGSSHNYLQYELNGKYQKRVRIDGSQPLVIRTGGTGRQELWIYKATEAHTGDILIQSVSADGARSLESRSPVLIEFIGNSITCGAAADTSEVPCGRGAYHDQHNAYMAYGPRVARAIGAEFMLSSVSGIGVYRNWNSDGPVMPEVYEQLNFRERSSRPWDFGSRQPAVVCVALGTNDFSNGDGKQLRLPFDSMAFTTGYIRFVQRLKYLYPRARIALLSSPMLHGNRDALLRTCLQRIKATINQQFPDNGVRLFFFAPMQARGCTGHPSVEDHAILADQLLPFMRMQLDR